MNPVLFAMVALSSGIAVIANAGYDMLLWPVSTIMCPPSQKMTTHSGCQPKHVKTADDTSAWVCIMCCLLSTGALWWNNGFPAAFLWSGTCCALSMLIGVQEFHNHTGIGRRR
jgi:hypothetical protein